MLNRLRGLDTRNPDPPFSPQASPTDSEAYPVGDENADVPATRPEYIADPSRGPTDPLGKSLIGVLDDILSVLLGTYSSKHRPEQINISPTAGRASYTTHTRTHITAIKGSAGTAATRIDITIGTEVVESIYLGAGVPFAVPASLWLDRGTTVTAVDGVAGKVDFSCILVAAEVD